MATTEAERKLHRRTEGFIGSGLQELEVILRLLFGAANCFDRASKIRCTSNQLGFFIAEDPQEDLQGCKGWRSTGIHDIVVAYGWWSFGLSAETKNQLCGAAPPTGSYAKHADGWSVSSRTISGMEVLSVVPAWI